MPYVYNQAVRVVIRVDIRVVDIEEEGVKRIVVRIYKLLLQDILM
jgi:hypothetical protein